MKKPASFFILTASLVLLASCKVYRNPNNLNPKYPIESAELGEEIPGLQNLLVGDKIKISRSGQGVSYLIYAGIEEESIFGEMWKDQARKLEEPKSMLIPLNQIESIRVKRKSLGATLGWTLGLGLATTIGMTIILADVYSQIGPDDF